MTVCAYSFKKYTSTSFKGNYFSLKLFWIFSFKIDGSGPGFGYKLGQNPGSGSGSKFNVFGSTTPLISNIIFKLVQVDGVPASVQGHLDQVSQCFICLKFEQK